MKDSQRKAVFAKYYIAQKKSDKGLVTLIGNLPDTTPRVLKSKSSRLRFAVGLSKGKNFRVLQNRKIVKKSDNMDDAEKAYDSL